jgi:hypothetical protein
MPGNTCHGARAIADNKEFSASPGSFGFLHIFISWKMSTTPTYGPNQKKGLESIKICRIMELETT